MEAINTDLSLLHAGWIATLVTILMGLILFALIRVARFGASSLIRCLLGSFACSTVVLGCFLLFAVLSFPFGEMATMLILLGLLAGVVLTLPVQLLIFGLPVGEGMVVWITYVVFTPLVVLWIMVLLPSVL